VTPFPWSRKRAEPEPEPPSALEVVRAYHQRTKHSPYRYAAGPHDLDWANQPDPFRVWEGAPRVELERLAPVAGEGLRYTEVWRRGERAAAALEARNLSRLLYDAFALSAWKQYGESRWALRVNPSSGNLHPTEVHVVAPAVEGIADRPFVAHYAPREHALELRAELAPEAWAALGVPEGTLLVALSSIHWREAWKYGERAWRYCQHDAGHAMAALSLSAAALGWGVRPVEAFGRADLERLLGLGVTRGPEAEVPDVLLAVGPGAVELEVDVDGVLARWEGVAWRGSPSALSPEHVEWDVIDVVSEVTADARGALEARVEVPERAAEAPAGPPWREVVHHRRSAVAMDGRTSMALDDFANVLRRTLPVGAPFDLFARAHVDLVLFVHRVEGLERGLYVLVRDPARQGELRAAFRDTFEWAPLAGHGDLPLARLHAGDLRGLAARISCQQSIAGDGCFSLGMLADLGDLERAGAALYPRLFHETGAIGQVLYLEAEALGLRGTGIGCFFDDEVHAVLGLTTQRFQSLYHFAFGAPVEDTRLSTLPAYGD